MEYHKSLFMIAIMCVKPYDLCVLVLFFFCARSAEEFMTDPLQDKWKRHTVLSNDSGYSTTDSLEKIAWASNVSEVSCWSVSVITALSSWVFFLILLL